MGKMIIRGQKSREGILKGIIETGNTVAITFGPRGRTVSYSKGSDTKITKDGISVIKQIQFSDELKDIGAKLVKEASDKANEISGDGSTSTAILTTALCNEVNKLLNQGIDINDLRSGFRLARDQVLKELQAFKKSISDEAMIKNIAKVSANGDDEIASKVTEAFTSIGDGGIVTYADSMSRTGKTEVIISNGFEIDKGYLTSKCVNAANNQCILPNASTIIFKEMVEDVNSFTTLLQSFVNKNVLIIAPEYSEDIVAWYTDKAAKQKVVLIRAPGYSIESINANLQDIAVMVNAKIVGEDCSLEEFTNKMCGHADYVITRNSTVISNPDTDTERFDGYIKNLKESSTENDSVVQGKSHAEIDSIKKRIARLSGGIATIYIGALTTPELGEKKDRYDDAINAVRNSLSNGFVVGASTALLRCSYYDYNTSNLSISEKTAFKAFLKAMRAPGRLLIKSTGEDYESVITEIIKSTSEYGFNARSAKVENLIEAGIIDPFTVIERSVIYSANMAEQFMSIDGSIVTDIKNLAIEPLDEVLDPGRCFGE